MICPDALQTQAKRRYYIFFFFFSECPPRSDNIRMSTLKVIFTRDKDSVSHSIIKCQQQQQHLPTTDETIYYIDNIYLRLQAKKIDFPAESPESEFIEKIK
jgi:hypothetical protein